MKGISSKLPIILLSIGVIFNPAPGTLFRKLIISFKLSIIPTAANHKSTIVLFHPKTKSPTMLSIVLINGPIVDSTFVNEFFPKIFNVSVNKVE